MYYVYQVEEKKTCTNEFFNECQSAQGNLSRGAVRTSTVGWDVVDERKNDHGVFSCPHINPAVLGT